MTVSKNKILVWAVILLMIANVALLATIWITHDKQRPARGTPADYLVKELGLNNEQQRKLRSLAKEHHERAIEIKEKIKTARENFFKLLSKPDNDTIKNADPSRSSFLSEIGENLKQLDVLTFDHFQQVRALCTPAQQKKFDEIIGEVLQMIASGPPPGRGPGNGEHMPPAGDHPPPPGQ